MAQETAETDAQVVADALLVVEAAERRRGGVPVTDERPPHARHVVPALVVLAVVTGGLERWWVAAHPLGTLTSDGAVVGLMASQFLHHGQLPAYYWGQAYGGSIEAVLTAAVFAVAGTGTAQLLAASALSSALAALALWRAGRHLVGEPAAGLGALVFWMCSASVMLRSLKPGGTYMVGLALALCAVGALGRLRGGDHRLRVCLVAGLWCGLALWACSMAVQLLVPAMLWCAPVLWRLGRRLPALVLGVLVGAAPAIRYGLSHGWSNVLLPGGDGTVLDRFGVRLVQFFQVELPIALNLRVEGSLDWVAFGLGLGLCLVLTAVALAAFAVLVAVVVSGRARRCRLPVLTLVLLPVLYALDPLADHAGQGRYVLFGTTMLTLLVGVGLENAGRALAPVLGRGRLRRLGRSGRCARARGRARARRRRVRPQALWLAGLALLVLSGLVALGREPGAVIVGVDAPDVPMPVSDAGVYALVRAHHVHAAYAVYWITYRVDFETHESLVLTPDDLDRYQRLDRQVAASPKPPYLFVSTSSTLVRFRIWCHRHGVAVRSWSDGGFTLVQPAVKVLLDEVPYEVFAQYPNGKG